MGMILGFEAIEIYVSDAGYVVLKQDNEALQDTISIPIALLDILNKEIKRVATDYKNGTAPKLWWPCDE